MADITPPNPGFDQALNVYRGEIDGIDDKILALLKDRSGIVRKVAALKAKNAPGKCPVRAGREAQQLRCVVEALKGSDFPPAAGALMWRMMIMAALSLEGDIKISVYAPEGRDYFGLARDYFGSFSTFIRQTTPKRVMGDLIDGKAHLGVLPPFTDQTHGRWWTDIPGKNAESRPKIFGVLPFVHASKPSPSATTAFAVGMVEPEETGDDLSYLLIEADEMASHSRVQAAFAQVKLEARWLEVLSTVPGKRHHLVEIKGFVTPQHEKYKAFVASLNNAIIATSFLGAAATPVILNQPDQSASSHSSPQLVTA